MPKTYTEHEREFIKSKLRKAALECMSIYGIRKTTVDELVRRVKIPKGTFYLFYNSKELLLYEVIMQLHDDVQSDFLERIKSQADQINVDILTDIFFTICKQVLESGLLKIMVSGELEVLIRRLPAEVLEMHMEQDYNMTKMLIASLPSAQGKDASAFSAALQGMLGTLLLKEELGKEFDKGLRIIIRGIVMQLLDARESL